MEHKKITIGAAVAALSAPFVASAQTLGSMAGAIAGQVIILATWLVVIMWVYTGIMFLTAQGEPGKVNTAKNALLASIGGTLLIILAQGAVAIVRNSFGL